MNNVEYTVIGKHSINQHVTKTFINKDIANALSFELKSQGYDVVINTSNEVKNESMNKVRYLHLDCEMGGRDLNFSLLTAYFLVTDENFNKLDDLSLLLKPDDGTYILRGEGMEVNKINLQKHDKEAIAYKSAKPLLFNFLKKWGPKLIPVGHGVRGDISHIIDKLISEGSWNQFCTYHYIDTSVVLQFLRACGKMPMDCDGSVEALSKYFLIEPTDPGEYPCYHNAEYDTIMTMKIYQKMIELGKN